jgi:hypothetical protein
MLNAIDRISSERRANAQVKTPEMRSLDEFPP